MDELRRLELRVGLITLTAIALFLLGITWARGVRLGVGEREIRVRFPTAAGIEVGAPVFVYGVRRGSVAAVELQGDSVVLSLRVHDVPTIGRDASARIGLQELTGGRKVDLFPGTSPEPLPPGATIAGTVGPDVVALLENLGVLGTQAQRVLERLDTATAVLTAVLSPARQQELQQLVADLAVFSQRLRAFAETHGDALGRTAENAAALSEELRSLLARQGPGIDTTLQSLRRTVLTAEQTIARIDSLITELRRTSERLRSLAERVQTGKSVAARLLTDEAFAQQLDSTLVLLRDFVGQVRQYGINVNVRLGTRP